MAGRIPDGGCRRAWAGRVMWSVGGFDLVAVTSELDRECCVLALDWDRRRSSRDHHRPLPRDRNSALMASVTAGPPIEGSI